MWARRAIESRQKYLFLMWARRAHKSREKYFKKK